jgi:catechol 2,3-dioxygenase
VVGSRLIEGVARIDLRVREIGRALSFYRDVIGLEAVEQTPVRASLRSAGGPYLLTLTSTGVSEPADPSATGLFHVAIRFPTRAALGDVLARTIERGYRVGAGDHLVSEALYVDDPDGNGVELYWDRPREQWPAPAADAAVPMPSLPVDLRSVMDEGRGSAAVGDMAPEGTDVGHVHLQVSDIEATSRFYVETLGLDLMMSLPGSAAFFSSNGYHHHIGANTWRSRGGRPPKRNRAGLDRVTLSAGAEEIDKLRSRLMPSGRNDIDQEPGSLSVHDPDDITLQFVEGGGPLPR